MLFSRSPKGGNVDRLTLEAISRSMAVIEFDLDGRILTANQNFLSVLGYELSEVVGQHHRLFVEPADSISPDYKLFWERLRKGEFAAAEYKRIGKGGREVWIQASYNPILGVDGKPIKVVKFATDITTAKLKSADAQGQIAAISKSQAVIEFDLQGTILTANANFCAAMGYQADEIVGRHHRMFVQSDYAQSQEYQQFWDRLGRGEYQAAEYLRIGKGGRPVWIQASYNPIFDMNGRPFKVVKYATDITARKDAVDQLGKGLMRLADGDLSVKIDQVFTGELDEVRLAFNETIERFARIVGQLRGTSRSLRTATGEILSGANDLAERTTKQAAAIEETSAAMEQLSTTVAQNAKRADSANDRSRLVSHSAEETGEVMRKSNEAMERISASSAKISGIIGMIDDIAFQTNLLALNASVEAARAGDAGKGFAVVAVEVRRLAQSAASASTEVKQLIEQSGIEVAGGSRLVSDAGQRLQSMLSAVQETAALVDEIARATQEQSSAIAEVTTAVRQMDEMTQHNAALVEQTNAAIEQTETQATELDGIVEVFVLDRSQKTAVVSNERPPLERASKPVAAKTTRGRNTVAGRYLSDGNAAISDDWNEF